MKSLRFSSALLMFLIACRADLTLPTGVVVSCQSDGDCPTGTICRQSLGRCVVPGSDDAAPSVQSVSVTPALARAGSTVEVKFTVSESLGQAPVVLLGTSARPAFSSTLANGNDYVYTYAPDGSEGAGVWPILVSLVDNAGNVADALLLANVRFDFEAPVVVSATSAYFSDAGNPLAIVTALRNGARLRVWFSTSEPVRIAPPPSVRALCSPAPLSLVASSAPTDTTFVYDLQLDAGVVVNDGDCALVVDIEDTAGNGATSVPLQALTVRIDRTAPDSQLAIDPSMLRHLRAPWGAAQTDFQPGQFIVPAGLGGAPVSGAVIANAAFAQSGDQVVQVRLYDSQTLGAQLGVVNPTAGGWPATKLGFADSTSLWVSVIDAAGNESTRRKVSSTTWVATLGGKIAGSTIENPHTFETRRLLDTSTAITGLEADVGLGTRDATTVATSSAASWRLMNPSDAPRRRSGPGLAFDPRSASVLLVGGYYPVYPSDPCDGQSNTNQCPGTWRWDGAAWTQIAPTDPEGDGDPAFGQSLTLVADPRNDAILLGGTDTQLWSFNGVSWKHLIATDPEGDGNPDLTYHPAMTYDPVRREVVLFDGNTCPACTGNTWTWNGTSWRKLVTAHAPGSRRYPLLAFDRLKGETVLFGGESCGGVSGECADTWVWDGIDWTNVTDAAPVEDVNTPPSRSMYGMAYDSARGVTVLFGGFTSNYTACPTGTCAAVWEWDGFGWSKATPIDPEGDGNPEDRWDVTLAFDPARGQTLAFGGQAGDGYCDDSDNDYCGAFWAWDGVSWKRLHKSNPGSLTAPSQRQQAAVAYDPGRDIAVYYGGLINSGSACDGFPQPGLGSAPCPYTWLWNNIGWQLDTTGNPAQWRWDVGMTLAPYTVGGANDKRLILFGGSTCTQTGPSSWSCGWVANETYAYDGSTWANVTPGGSPGTRADHAMAYDSGRNRAVMFGGASGTLLGDTWEWTGAAWSQRCLSACTPPSARFYHAMAYMPANALHAAHTLMFGGWSSQSCFTEYASQETWSWSGSTWTPESPGPSPKGRFDHGMAYDAQRGSVILYGGQTCTGAMAQPCDGSDSYCGDVWEWNGQTWKQIPVVDVEGDGNPGRRTNHSMYYDDASGHVMAIGGREWLAGGSFVDSNEVWAFESGHDKRPGQIFRVNFGSAGSGLLGAVQLKGLTVAWWAAGESFPAGTRTTGAALQVFDGGRWRPVASNSADVAGSPDGTWQLGYVSTDEDTIRALFLGTPVLMFAATPSADNGTAFGKVATDYAEVRLDYLR